MDCGARPYSKRHEASRSHAHPTDDGRVDGLRHGPRDPAEDEGQRAGVEAGVFLFHAGNVEFSLIPVGEPARAVHHQVAALGRNVKTGEKKVLFNDGGQAKH